MKKLLVLVLLVVVTCFLPTLALAAFNDVALTTDVVINVGGYTVSVTGSSAVVQSIVVNASNFSITLASGSSAQITSPTYQQFTVDVGTFTSSNVCSTNASVLTLSSSGASGTATITPQATVCSTPTPTVSSGGGNGPIVGLYGTRNSGTVGFPWLSTASGTSSSGGVIPAVATSTATLRVAAYRFVKDLKLGKNDVSVQKLQQFLNTHGYTVTITGAGSKGKESTYFGNATRAALIKFQKAQRITPAVGYFGPITRATVGSMK